MLSFTNKHETLDPSYLERACMPSTRAKGHLPKYLIGSSGLDATLPLRMCSAALDPSLSHMQWYLRCRAQQSGSKLEEKVIGLRWKGIQAGEVLGL